MGVYDSEVVHTFLTQQKSDLTTRATVQNCAVRVGVLVTGATEEDAIWKEKQFSANRCAEYVENLDVCTCESAVSSELGTDGRGDELSPYSDTAIDCVVAEDLEWLTVRSRCFSRSFAVYRNKMC